MTFFAKGKSLSNTPRTIRNLIGDSATWRQDDWSKTVGKSLPRTPVNKPKLYPDLSAITETVEPASDGVPLLPAPGIPEKRKRANNVKHQLLVRKSERLKARACQNTENGKEATKQDNYLEIVNDSENEEDEGDDDFESTKSYLESDTEENDKVIEERVDAELKKKEVAAQPATGHQQTALSFSRGAIRACRLQKLYLFAYPTEEGKPIDPAVLQLREKMLMDGFLGGLKSNLRERMSLKDYKNLNDLVKATEKCPAVLSEAKLEKRSVEFVNAISADANAHELRETKNEISELKSAIEQLAQKLPNTTLGGNNKETVNVVATTQATQITESKREIEEFKNLLRASNKNYSDMMKQSRDVEKAMKNLQIQVAGTSQPTSQAQPVMQYQQNHSSQFVTKVIKGHRKLLKIIIITRVSSQTDTGKKDIAYTARQEVEHMATTIPRCAILVQVAQNVLNVKGLTI